jgi:BirA family biotin operon repressor/biotin-[acetyl-CoA-carboxylase] ligase
LSPGEIGRRVKNLRVAREIHSLREVTSTNEIACEMALKGAPEGVVVIAETQTRGRGRINRGWVSPPGRNVYLSLILRPRMVPHLSPFLTYMGAISAAEALIEAFRLEVSLKWPNDVLVNGKKLAGLLNEVRVETDQVDFVILGFGININMEEEAFPDELRGNATSVMIELGHAVSRVEMTRCLLERLETWYETFLHQGVDPVIDRWESLARVRGTRIEVRSLDQTYRGVAEGLDRDGALILRDGKDRIIRVVAGDVRGHARPGEGDSW